MKTKTVIGMMIFNQIIAIATMSGLARAQEAEAKDVCQVAAEAQVDQLENREAQQDSNYQYGGIGQTEVTEPGTYDVEFGFNDECLGGYTVKAEKSEDGLSCRIISVVADPSSCG